jgi:3-hydroxy-9,10-secoandrosta-1,3,5(10)-triene-9,17-dione monooxygenase reductase component
VITSEADHAPLGLAVGSFFSVSLDPPLVGFGVAKSSTSWPAIRETGRFCANVLADDQEAVCRVFASSGGEKFQGVGWRPSSFGSPVLAGVLAWIDCSLDAEHEAGDHTIVVGRVRELDVPREGHPLLFFRGGYAQLA